MTDRRKLAVICISLDYNTVFIFSLLCVNNLPRKSFDILALYKLDYYYYFYYYVK